MSAVWPSALVIFWLRYLPRPSWVMPRSTFTPISGTSANLIVLFWPDQIACERPADVKNPLENRENREHRQHVHSWREKVDVEDASPLREHQPYREDYYPDRARGQPALVLDAQRLCPGARVADHQRPEHRK